MAAPPSLGLLLFLASSLSFLLVAVSLYFKKWRRRRRREEENGCLTATWEAAAAAPPPASEAAPLIEGGDGAAVGGGGEEKRRKKRGKKKRQGSDGGEEGEKDRRDGGGGIGFGGGGKGGGECPCPFPFSSFASATQRKIKVQYDQLVRSNQAKALTMDQVGQFVNCLVAARNDLQHKSEIIRRSFKIKKALLFKADRSSFDRLCQQIYKLEAEHKRLEEDATVYNLLQEQLKLSPAYKTMLEVGANMELKGSAEQAMEFSDISFEELLAQEKKDSFWQRNGRLRSSAS